MRRSIHALPPILVIGFAILLAGLTWHLPRTDTPDRLARGLPLRVGYSIEEPYAWRRDDGRVTGEAPELLRRALREAGIGQEPLWLHVEFDSLLHELQADRIDVIAAGLFATPERRRHALFTRPTAQVRVGLLVPQGNPLRLRDLASLVRHPEARLGVIAGSVEEQQARRLGLPPARLHRFPDKRSAAAGMQLGRVDAFALSAPSLRHLLTLPVGSGLVLLEPGSGPGSGEPGHPAFALRPSDAALQRRLDAALARLLGSPAHLELVAPFGFSAQEIASPPPGGGR